MNRSQSKLYIFFAEIYFFGSQKNTIKEKHEVL
jgi:hypothetical protein